VRLFDSKEAARKLGDVFRGILPRAHAAV
jgi:hypothetical protein